MAFAPPPTSGMADYEYVWTIPVTPELRNRWERAKQETAAELPELIELGQRMREASAEETLSGYLRRAIHRSPRELADIAAAAGITPLQLNEFLGGERTLRSDVLDRLASAADFSQALAQLPLVTGR